MTIKSYPSTVPSEHEEWNFLGSEPSLLVFQILISHRYDMFFLAQQAGLGGDRQNHAEPFQRYVEGSRYYLNGPLS